MDLVGGLTIEFGGIKPLPSMAVDGGARDKWPHPNGDLSLGRYAGLPSEREFDRSIQ
jgi:hypothetical protein